MDYKENVILFEEIDKNFLIKVKKLTKIKTVLKSKYDNEIVIKFTVYK